MLYKMKLWDKILICSFIIISLAWLVFVLLFCTKEDAKLIEQGKYNNINEVETNTSELHELSVSVKELAERLNYQETLKRRMTTDIAHELRTPLAAIQSHIEAFMDDPCFDSQAVQVTPSKLINICSKEFCIINKPLFPICKNSFSFYSQNFNISVKFIITIECCSFSYIRS